MSIFLSESEQRTSSIDEGKNNTISVIIARRDGKKKRMEQLLPRTRTALLRRTRVFRDPRHVHALERALREALSRQSSDGAGVARIRHLETRLKSPISMWHKLMRKGVLPCVSLEELEHGRRLQREDEEVAEIIEDQSIDLLSTGEIFDVVGTRVFVHDEDDCYTARRQLLSACPPFRFVEHRSRDYIRGCERSPQERNGYQSLHETVFFPLSSDLEMPAEIQIRTPAMHDVAETGSAAHAEYKRARFAEGRCSSAAFLPM